MKSLIAVALFVTFVHAAAGADRETIVGFVVDVKARSLETASRPDDYVNAELTSGLPALSAARVSLYHAGEVVPLRSAITERNGTFRFDGLTAGTYDVSVEVGGEDERRQFLKDVEVKTGEVCALTLSPGEEQFDNKSGSGWLTLHVSDLKGADLAGATIRLKGLANVGMAKLKDCDGDLKDNNEEDAKLFQEVLAQGGIPIRVTDGKGEVTFHLLPPCHYTFDVRIPGLGISATSEADVKTQTAPPPLSIAIKLPDGLGRIDGRCLGECVGAVWMKSSNNALWMVPISESPLPWSSLHEPRSSFQFAHLPEGQYELGLFERGARANREVHRGESVQILLDEYGKEQPGNALFLSARQRLKGESLPAKDVTLDVLDADGDTVQSCETGFDGNCKHLIVEPGEYTVEAKLSGFRKASVKVKVSPQRWTDAEVVLDVPVPQGNGVPVAPSPLLSPTIPGVGLAGFVDSETKLPAPISIRSANSGTELTPLKIVKAGYFDYGQATQMDLKPGRYVMTVKTSDWQREIGVVLENGRRTFVPVIDDLMRTDSRFSGLLGGIEVSVQDPQGRPIQGARVFGMGKDADDDDDDEQFCGPTPAGGNCMAAGIKAGEWGVFAAAPGYQQSGVRVVTVKGQELTPVKLILSSIYQHDAQSVARLTGTLVDQQNQEYAGARVVLSGGTRARCSITGEHGEFVFQWIPANQPYRLTFYAAGLGFDVSNINVGAGKKDAGKFTFPPGQGTLKKEECPAPE